MPGHDADRERPFIVVACASQTNLYVPSVNVTCHVSSPMSVTSVDLLTPGPVRSKLCMSDWSSTWIVYSPGSRCVTWRRVASVSEIVKPSAADARLQRGVVGGRRAAGSGDDGEQQEQKTTP